MVATGGIFKRSMAMLGVVTDSGGLAHARPHHPRLDRRLSAMMPPTSVTTQAHQSCPDCVKGLRFPDSVIIGPDSCTAAHDFFNARFALSPSTRFLPLLLLCCTPYLSAQSDNDPLDSSNALTTAQPAFREARIIGFTRAAAEIAVIPEVSGRCLALTADVGEALPQSGVFARLDDTFIKLEIETNANRQAALKSRTAYLKRELDRSQTLNRSAALSASELEQVQEDYDQAMLDLQALQTEAAILDERLKRHQVIVQPNWRIITRDVEPGQWVGAGTPIGRAADFTRLLVPVSLTYQEYRALRALASIPVRLTDLDQTLPAKLVKVSPGFDPETRKIQAELELSSGLAERRGGLRAEIDVPTEAEPHTFLVNTAAISERYNTFWLKRPNGEEVEIAVLERNANGIARVRSPNITAGDRFALEGGAL